MSYPNNSPERENQFTQRFFTTNHAVNRQINSSAVANYHNRLQSLQMRGGIDFNQYLDITDRISLFAQRYDEIPFNQFATQLDDMVISELRVLFNDADDQITNLSHNRM